MGISIDQPEVMQSPLERHNEVIRSLREGLTLKSELIDRLKGDHAKELAA